MPFHRVGSLKTPRKDRNTNQAKPCLIESAKHFKKSQHGKDHYNSRDMGSSGNDMQNFYQSKKSQNDKNFDRIKKLRTDLNL